MSVKAADGSATGYSYQANTVTVTDASGPAVWKTFVTDSFV